MKAKGYAVPRAVKADGAGDLGAREEKGSFFFLLVCGHRSPCKTRKDWRGHTVAVPRQAEARDCAECRAEFVAKGLPIPPCPCCKGRGTMIRGSDTTNGKGHRSVTVSKVTCWWCKGRTAPARTAPASTGASS